MRRPSLFARPTTVSIRLSDSSIVALIFFWLKVLEVAVTTAISLTPAASANSNPFSFGISEISFVFLRALSFFK